MIRTEIVTLTLLPGIAYRQKLTAGGSGIVIMREGTKQPGIASISKTGGNPILSANTPKDAYPQKAFKEAMELTSGMPYTKRGTPSPEQIAIYFKAEVPVMEAVPEEKEEAPAEIIIDSKDYQKIVDTYTDKNGKLSYELLNKDMIRFAYSSSTVRSMFDNKDSVEAIRLYIVSNKFKKVTGNPNLSDEQVLAMVELLDEVSPKGVFRELNEYLRQNLKK